MITYQEAIKKSMEDALKEVPHSVIYGLGVTDHIGIFNTTKDLEAKYGSHRVFETPISEDSMTGVALGLSLGGVYPIHIHIRADFLLLAMNQIVNSIAKYRYMYGGLYEAPMLIRAVIGRSWGQGAQHSQSLQSLFAHIPGLTVIMPSSAQSIINSYEHIVKHYKNPVISFEHRLLYDYKFEDISKEDNPMGSKLIKEGNDITVIATSIMNEEALKASSFMGSTVSMEIIDIHNITDMDEEMVLRSVRKTKKVIVLDTSWVSFGVCAEVSRVILEANIHLKMPIINLGMAKATCPTAKLLENEFYTDLKDIVDAAYTLYYESKAHNQTLPSSEEVAYMHKHFKGPF